MKKTLLTALFVSASITLFSQVGVNTKTPYATLDINGSLATQESKVTISNDKVTIPASTAFANLTGATANFTIEFSATSDYTKIPNGQRIIVFNNTDFIGTYENFSIPAKTAQEFVHSDKKWYSFKASAQNFVYPEKLRWFYAPSLVLETSVNATAKTVNVYDNYIKQFTKHNNSASEDYGFISSNSQASTIPYYTSATDFDYFITGYDRSVFEKVSISTNGLLTYTVKSAATDKTFMNIILVPKS